MINHVTVKVKDFDKEEAFYEAALAPLGYSKGPAFPGVQAFVAEDGSSVWVSTAAEGDTVAPVHVAFEAAGDDADRATIPSDGTRLPSDGIVIFAHAHESPHRRDRSARPNSQGHHR